MGIQTGVRDAEEVAGDVTCNVFNTIQDGLDPTRVHRFIVGIDDQPQPLSPAEGQATLGDPLATLLLLKGTFPTSARQLFDQLDAATTEGDPLRSRSFFLLGEGSQIPFSLATDTLFRGLRFVVSTKSVAPDGPDLIISVFSPDHDHIEAMAWDREHGGFNFYRTVGATREAWVFAGNSRNALSPPSEGKGPFESHPSGSLLMKELRFPWQNWHSPAAPILPTVFAPNDPLRADPWIQGLDPNGAITFETDVAQPAITRWAKRRFDDIQAAGAVERPERIVRQIVTTPTVNLIPSKTESAIASKVPTVDLPQTFFIDSQSLTELLGLDPPPPFAVSSAIYVESIKKFGYRLEDEEGFQRAGDTHFAFFVPEPAFEDHRAVAESIRIGLVTERLAGALLMTDFPNPVFSARRAELVEHSPATATIANGTSSFSDDMANAILAAATAKGDESPEAEFAAIWTAGDDGWRAAANQRLASYYTAVTARLTTQPGFDDYCRLAEARRGQVRAMPIKENELLFAHTNIKPGTRAMRSDGTITEAK